MEWVNKILEAFQSGIVQAVALFLLLAVEFWLGKSELVKPGSTVEVVLVGIKKVLEFLKIKKPD
jgi:hypothetical protein